MRTIESLCKLDADASPGPWKVHYHPQVGTTVQAPDLVGIASCAQGGADGELIAASKGFAPAVRALITGLAADLEEGPWLNAEQRDSFRLVAKRLLALRTAELPEAP